MKFTIRASPICMLPWLAMLLTGCSKSVTLVSLLNEINNRSAVTYYTEGLYTHRQFSSYNRESVEPGTPGWFANADMSHFIRVEETEGRREFVLFDATGPGAIVRWWMTFYKAQNGILRVYIDQQDTPAIAGSPAELVGGSSLAPPPISALIQAGAPLGEEGRDYAYNLYLPIPFARSCKITYECDSLRVLYDYEGTAVPQGYYWPDVFYNIGYRAYTPSTTVESFSRAVLERAAGEIRRTAGRLMLDPPPAEKMEPFSKTVQPGDSLIVTIDSKNLSVSHLRLSLEAGNVPQALRSTVLKITFDDQETVWAPVGEFFGTGYSLKPHRTRMNNRDTAGMMESFAIMPFRSQCRIALVNFGSQPVGLVGEVGLTTYRWKEGSMYFFTAWREYNRLLSRGPGGTPFDLNFIDIRGKGVYVGDQMTLFNPTYKWWGEGDEKIFVDGEAFPSSFGTGSEDYYGYSFAREESFSHPFLAQPEGVGNMHEGITVNMRHRVLDAIPFNRSISSNIEMWHWDSVCMNVGLTTWWYALPPCRRNVRPDPAAAIRPVAFKKPDLSPLSQGDSTSEYYTIQDFGRVPKIDAHFHYLSKDDRYIRFARELNFKLLTPVWDGEDVSIRVQEQLSQAIRRAYPGQYAWFTTFSANRFGEPGFVEQTLAGIRESISRGATGVKIWKNIGMVITKPDGRYLMVDDPVLEPVFDYLEDHHIPVIAHLGEPRDCWLPLESMTDPADVVYYKNNPAYYMYLHPEVPSYEAQIRARDRLLAAHPDLEFVGAHLASLEWSIDELAACLDRFPQLKVDLAARMYHIQYQSKRNYTRVREFFIKYQDRIIYGTDSEVHDIEGKDPELTMANLERGWKAHWVYLATDSVTGTKGLRLPRPVIDKIYYSNAARYFNSLKINL